MTDLSEEAIQKVYDVFASITEQNENEATLVENIQAESDKLLKQKELELEEANDQIYALEQERDSALA